MCGRLVKLLFKSDSLPLELVCRQVRIWTLLDFILFAAYLGRFIQEVKDGWSVSPALAGVTLSLAIMFGVDAVALFYMTHPSRVFALSEGVYHANTALNIWTLLINFVYLILELSEGLVAYVFLAVFVIVWKALRCHVLYNLAVRLAARSREASVSSPSYGVLPGNPIV